MIVKQEFEKHGAQWKLLERGPKLALYQRSGRLMTWEAVGIGKKLKTITLKGREHLSVEQEFLHLSEKDYKTNTWSFDNESQARAWFTFKNNQS